jgi:hypothetical protein
MDSAGKTHENRVRRMLGRQGYKLSKSRRRDPLALDYGRYTISRGAARFEVATLTEAEEWALAEPARRARRTGRS